MSPTGTRTSRQAPTAAEAALLITTTDESRTLGSPDGDSVQAFIEACRHLPPDFMVGLVRETHPRTHESWQPSSQPQALSHAFGQMGDYGV